MAQLYFKQAKYTMGKIESVKLENLDYFFNNNAYWDVIDQIWKESYGDLISYFGNISGSKKLLLITSKYVIFISGNSLYEFSLDNVKIELVKNNLLKSIISNSYEIKISSNLPISSNSQLVEVSLSSGQVVILNGTHTVRYNRNATFTLYNHIQKLIDFHKTNKDDFIQFNCLTFDSKKGKKDYTSFWCYEKLFLLQNKLVIINESIIEQEKKNINDITYEEVSFFGKKFKLISIKSIDNTKIFLGSYNSSLLDNKNTYVMYKALTKWKSIF
jgi:hypothetical protein